MAAKKSLALAGVGAIIIGVGVVLLVRRLRGGPQDAITRLVEAARPNQAHDVFARTAVARAGAAAANDRSFAALWARLAAPLLGRQAPADLICRSGMFAQGPRLDESVMDEWRLLRNDVSRLGAIDGSGALESSVTLNVATAPPELWRRYDQLKRRADSSAFHCG